MKISPPKMAAINAMGIKDLYLFMLHLPTRTYSMLIHCGEVKDAEAGGLNPKIQVGLVGWEVSCLAGCRDCCNRNLL